MSTRAHDRQSPGSAPGHPTRPVRVCLFTDTLGDVNGVSRFIRTIAEQAHRADPSRAVHVLTSTRMVCPDQANLHNVAPRLSRPMPGYPMLDVVWPNAGAMFKLADRLRPDVIHVSTPGPVGSVGRKYAKARGLPLVGTYHTDFPAYVDHLFDDVTLTWVTRWWMQRFYAPFSRVFTRSDAYTQPLSRLGVGAERVERLIAGIDTDAFGVKYRDDTGGIWAGLAGVRPASVKAVFVGRVSVEKNLPMLARVWREVDRRCRALGVDAQLLVVGDGPYRHTMHEQLAASNAVFVGFRHGVELSTIYASSDLFLFPSTTDTLGQVVLESQACGLPAIVSDVGGPAGLIEHGVTGLVLPVGTGRSSLAAEARWTQAIVELIQDPARRARMGAIAAQRVGAMSIRTSFEQFWNVHEGLARASAMAR